MATPGFRQPQPREWLAVGVLSTPELRVAMEPISVTPMVIIIPNPVRRAEILKKAAQRVAFNNPNRGTAGIMWDCQQKGHEVTQADAFNALCDAFAVQESTSGLEGMGL